MSGADLGFLITLGDIALENVDKDCHELKFLMQYQPSKIESEVRRDGLRLHTGILENGFLYKREIVAAPNRTYALRHISFSDSPTDSYDFLILFRTLRQLDDGSYIIAWKIFNRFPSPSFTRKH